MNPQGPFGVIVSVRDGLMVKLPVPSHGGSPLKVSAFALALAAGSSSVSFQPVRLATCEAGEKQASGRQCKKTDWKKCKKASKRQGRRASRSAVEENERVGASRCAVEEIIIRGGRHRE